MPTGPAARWAALAVGLLVLLASACTGAIDAPGSGDCRNCPPKFAGGFDGAGGSGAGPGAGPGSGPGSTPIPGTTETPIDPVTGQPAVEGIAWTTRFPRLSHEQWENTVRDLLRLPARPELAATFATDPDDSRFDNFGERIVSANLWADYQRAAETVAADVAGDATKLARIRPTGASSDARAFVTQLGRRAFRRPLEASETDAFVALFAQGTALTGRADSFAAGAELVLQTMLQSVHFLYRVESTTEEDNAGKVWLGSYEVASRLSYALWNSMPSDELLDAAGADELSSKQGVEQWTRKMLADPRAADTLVEFHSQLLNVAEYGSIAKNTTLFPTFSTALQPIIQDEARSFVREVSAVEGGGIEALLTSSFTFVNDKTAAFYGVTGSFGSQLQKVQLDPEQRAGFLTQIGFLSKYASQTQSNPILRGVHISLDFLCSSLPAPPPDIPPVPALKPNQTNRERFAELTKPAPCNSCHETLINPLGFAFENYDAIGQWRDMDNGKPVDASAMYALDGTNVPYSNAVELAQLLAESKTVHRCYSDRWLEYALGRPPADPESGSVEKLAQVSAHDSATLQDLLSTMTGLETFRARTEEDAP
jgi:hypothetical protein